MYLYDPIEKDKKFEISNSVRYLSFLIMLCLAILFPLFWESLYVLCEDATVALMS